MTRTLAISEARSRLLDLPAELEKEAGMVIVTKHGKNVLAILPWEFYEAIEETLEVLSDEGLMADLRKSLEEAERGKLVSWEQVKKRHKL